MRNYPHERSKYLTPFIPKAWTAITDRLLPGRLLESIAKAFGKPL